MFGQMALLSEMQLEIFTDSGYQTVIEITTFISDSPLKKLKNSLKDLHSE